MSSLQNGLRSIRIHSSTSTFIQAHVFPSSFSSSPLFTRRLVSTRNRRNSINCALLSSQRIFALCSPLSCNFNALQSTTRLYSSTAESEKEKSSIGPKDESTKPSTPIEELQVVQPPIHYLKDADSNIERAVRMLQNQKGAMEAYGDSKAEVAKQKKNLWEMTKEVVHHYWTGFKLLGTDVKITFRLVRRVTQGYVLSRRERKQLVRTASDMFRLVPFLVFVIVPFMEFTLPIFLRLFPNMLPSTFQDALKQEENQKKQLKVKIEVAKFLHKTVEEMALHSSKKDSQSVEEFVGFFERIRATGQTATNEEIVHFSKLFENQLTLDNLSRQQLVALCKVLNLPSIGTSNILIFQLKMKLRQLRADDLMIESEGIKNLTVQELQSACQARGMRSIGLTKDQLLRQLQQWLDLHIHMEIPASLLLLSRILFLTETVPSPEQLEATLKALPRTMVTEAEVQMAEVKGEKISNKSKLELIQLEEERIKAEEEETRKTAQEKAETDRLRIEKAKLLEENEKLISQLPSEAASTLKQTLAEIDKDDKITVEELQEIREAISTMSSQSAFISERQELEELKEDREEYKEDLAQVLNATLESVRENKVSERLGRRIEAMISKLEKDIVTVETSSGKARQAGEALITLIDEDRDGKISLNEMVRALKMLKKAPSAEKTERIVQMLDVDKDGFVSVEEIMHLVDLLEEEHAANSDVKLDQISELVSLLQKEEKLEDKEEELESKHRKENQEKQEKLDKQQKMTVDEKSAAQNQSSDTAATKK